MNAVEWRRRRPDRPVDLVLVADRGGGGEAIELLLVRAPGLWRRVLRRSARPRARGWAPRFASDVADAVHRATLRRLARRLDPAGYDAVAFGDLRNLSQRAIVERVAHESLVLLDDGSVAPQAMRWRAGLPTPDPERFASRWFRTGPARLLFGDPPPASPKRVTFFTIYGSLPRGDRGTQDHVETHAFESWRPRAQAARGDAVWLLGSNHAAARIAAPEAYERLILGGVAALRAEGFAGPVTYRPHRNEDPAAVAALARRGGFALDVSPAPAELAYLDADPKPAAVAVVASSAADTLSVIDPELPIVRFALPEDYLRRHRDHILAVVSGHDAFNTRLRRLTPLQPPPPGPYAPHDSRN